MKSFEGFDPESIEELKPGHYLSDEGIFQYYKIPDTMYVTGSVQTVSEKVRILLESSVKKRVQTDLPVAVFLSGGIDSSIIHLLCCKYHDNVTGLIIGEDSSEDVKFAKRFCKDLRLKSCHINIDKNELLQNVSEVVHSIETFEPNAVRGSLLSMKLSKIAHELGFKIAICGEGSDEVFAGYGDFLYITDENEFQEKIMRLLNDLYRTQLLRIDKTGMNFAVEIREPFLDRELVEYALNIPPRMKVAVDQKGRKVTKFILREAFKDILPEYIYDRPKMTLLEGAGTGNVEKEDGILFEYAVKKMSNEEFHKITESRPEFNLQNKEEAYCFKLFFPFYSKAKFSVNRVVHAQKEIPKGY
jgi:asparagine synthase (glutamine-hydrolysing)